MTNEKAVRLFTENLIRRIEHHKEEVGTANKESPIVMAYHLAHDHIIEVIRQELSMWEGGGNNDTGRSNKAL